MRLTRIRPTAIQPNIYVGVFAGALCVICPWSVVLGASHAETKDNAQRTTNHWAFQPIQRCEPPEVKNHAWVRNPIDNFILAQLEAAGISPSPQADRYTLIKRLSYDLVGLPPTLQQVDAFVKDDSPRAYETLVDRLLDSPHFGERWGRHWLDKARYADSDGYEKDRPRPNAWQYRDWVIHAVNNDMPFDQFTIEQLAGDLLPDATPMQKLATAFHRQTLTNTEGGVDQEEFRVEAIVDRVNTTGTVWLGLTVGCARCHSHKYDPIPQTEFYQLFAFFNNGDEAEMKLPISDEAVAQYEQAKAEYDAKVKALQAKLDSLADASTTTKKKLEQQLDTLKKQAPKEPFLTLRVIRQRTDDPRTTHLLRRGDFLQPQEVVQPGTLSVLHPFHPREDGSQAEPGNQRMPDRLDLARWLVSPDNPLTPRVAVNQIWGYLFGRGIVRTMNDFGTRGDPPTHPKLLDWLADEYMRLGWSRKAMIKRIVMSAAYRQSSVHRPELADVDPQNNLFYRQNRFRVEADIVRDLHLAASGLLVDKIGGPSVFPPMPPDLAALSYANNFRWNASQGVDRYRRGMYTFFKRTAPYPNLMTFDCPSSNTTTVQRRTSNTPLQALTTLNNEVFVEASQAMAQSILTGGRHLAVAAPKPADVTGAKPTGGNRWDIVRVTEMFRRCVVRPPSETELNRSLELLAASRRFYADHPDDAKKLIGAYAVPGVSAEESAAWTATARIIMNMDEFITRE